MEIPIAYAGGKQGAIADAKAYKPEDKSIVSGKLLPCPYEFEKARLAVQETADALALDLVDKMLVTSQIGLMIGYDIENLSDPKRGAGCKGPVTADRYRRKIPKHTSVPPIWICTVPPLRKSSKLRWSVPTVSWTNIC